MVQGGDYPATTETDPETGPRGYSSATALLEWGPGAVEHRKGAGLGVIEDFVATHPVAVAGAERFADHRSRSGVETECVLRRE